MNEPKTTTRGAALKFLWRAFQLHCPECGVSPLFLPLWRIRSWPDWSTPLAGCSVCNYAYEREPGYFLPAIWVVHILTVFALGAGLGVLLDVLFHPPLGLLLLMACGPTLLFALLFIRHAKAIYLAFDHYLEPQAKPNAIVAERSN